MSFLYHMLFYFIQKVFFRSSLYLFFYKKTIFYRIFLFLFGYNIFRTLNGGAFQCQNQIKRIITTIIITIITKIKTMKDKIIIIVDNYLYSKMADILLITAITFYSTLFPCVVCNNFSAL